jgi:hypothetical protein
MSEQRYVWYPDASINQWAKVPWAEETEFALHDPSRDSRSQEFDWGVAWRDDLRKGWHVVPEGVRYVGVSGAVEGQHCAPFGCGFNAVRAAARLNAGIESASLMAWHVPEWSKLDDSVGSVLDLHDLGDRRQPCTSEIVEAWDWALRGLEAVGDWAEIAKVKQTGLSWCSSSSGGSATWAEYQAARSRELHRRVTASSEATKEAERRRVLGPVDDEEFA